MEGFLWRRRQPQKASQAKSHTDSRNQAPDQNASFSQPLFSTQDSSAPMSSEQYAASTAAFVTGYGWQTPLNLAQPQCFQSPVQAEQMQSTTQAPQAHLQRQFPSNQPQVPPSTSWSQPYDHQAQVPLTQLQRQPDYANGPAPYIARGHDWDNFHQNHPDVGNDALLQPSFNESPHPWVSNDLGLPSNGEPIAPSGTDTNGPAPLAGGEFNRIGGTPSDTTYECNQCLKLFTTGTKLGKHMKGSHGPKNHCCQFQGCPKAKPGRGFTTAWARNRHEKNCSLNPETSVDGTGILSQPDSSPATAATEVETDIEDKRKVQDVNTEEIEDGSEEEEEHVLETPPQALNNDNTAYKSLKMEKKTRKHARKAYKVLKKELSGKNLRKIQKSFKKVSKYIGRASADSREIVAERFLDMMSRGGKGEPDNEDNDDDDDDDDEDEDDDVC